MSKHIFNPTIKSITERHDYLLGEKIDKLSLNNDGVEDLITTSNTHLNTINTNINSSVGAINNTGAIGDGSNKLHTVPLGYDRTNGKGVATLVDSSGRQLVNVIGNTSADGSGTANHLHVDASGNSRVSVVSTVNIAPANSVNAEMSPTQSFNVKWSNTPNVKLEDLSSSINADHASVSRSVAVGLRGRTDITDATTGKFLKCDTNGSLNVASNKTTGEWLASGSLADDAYSSALDCSKFSSIRLFGKWTGSTTTMPILGSQTTSGTYYKIGELVQTSVDIGGATEYHITYQAEDIPNFIKVYNESGGSKTMEIDYIGISN